MALVLFKKVSNSTVPTEAIENGKLLYDYQSKKIFLDEGGVRVGFYDFIGLLTSLTTTAKDTIVNAINELVTKTNTTNTNVGTLANLTTTAKSSIVNAINSLVTAINSIILSVGNIANLTTTAKTSIVEAINWMMSILLPNSATSYYTIAKPTIAVYGQTYRYYSVPFNRADLYSIALNDVNIVGLSSILTSCSISARYPTGFYILDTSEQGVGYTLQVSFTATKL